MRGAIGRLVLVAASLALAVAAAEGVLRARLDEVDYLQPRLAPHPVLRHVIEPGSGGHDAWGFRNRTVPETVEILAVGDSQTYGVSAPARESWPAWLAELTGRSVYNMGLGGYGPPDYDWLLRERGAALAPQIAVIGLYLGNDLPRAGNVAAGQPRPSRALAERDDPRRLGALRHWLAGHSVLYQVLKFELPALSNALRFREAAERDDAVAIAHPVAATWLTPELRWSALDPSRERNRRGLEASVAAFASMQSTCAALGARCLALLIPTKESVYAELAREQLDPAGYAAVETLVREETAVRDALVRAFEQLSLEWTDPLPALRAQVARTRLYPANADGHPNGAGYRVIAGSVRDALLREPAR